MKTATPSSRHLALAAAAALLAAPAAFGQTPTVYVSEISGIVTAIPAAGAAPATYATVKLANTSSAPDDLEGLTFDAASNLFVADFTTGVIDKITPGGGVTRFASLPNGLPEGIAFNPLNGNLYVSSGPAVSGGVVGTIYQITPQGMASTFATTANIEYPVGLAFDPSGNLYVAGLANTTNLTQVTRITLGGIQTVYATFSGRNPGGLAFNGNGTLFAADYRTGAITEIVPNAGGLTGTASAFANLGTKSSPGGLAFDPGGNLFVTDASALSPNRIAEISPDGKTVSTYTYDTNGPNFVAFAPFATPVPEPSTWALLGVGAGGLGLILHRRKVRV